MKRVFTIVAMLLALAMLPTALIGCNSGAEPTEAPTEAPTEKPTEKPTEPEEVKEGTTYEILDILDKLKVNGRYSKTDEGLACDNVGSGFEFQGVMKGKVYLSLRCNVSPGGRSHSTNAYFSVYIDGELQETRHRVTTGRNAVEFEIADLGDTEGEHHIRVVKQTEARYALAEYRTLTVDGTLGEAPAEKELYIEFAGSSLCCGMGNLGWPDMGVNPSQTAEYEDGTQGFAFLAAETLGADCSILGVSGMGLAKTWYPPLTFQDYYTASSYYRDDSVNHDFEASRKPDLIVLNTGKNDWQLKGNLTPPTEEEFVKAVRDTYAMLREKYGDEVPIVFAYDYYENHKMELVEPILEELGGEEAGYYACEVTSNRDGGDRHTDLKGHKQAAEKLVEFVENILNK